MCKRVWRVRRRRCGKGGSSCKRGKKDRRSLPSPLLLLALRLLPHCLPSLPRTTTFLPSPRDSCSLSLSSLHSPMLPGREATIPSLLECLGEQQTAGMSVCGEEPSPPFQPVAKPRLPSLKIARPSPPSQPVARLLSTPSCPPQTRDQVMINHEFALDTRSSNCDLCHDLQSISIIVVSEWDDCRFTPGHFTDTTEEV